MNWRLSLIAGAGILAIAAALPPYTLLRKKECVWAAERTLRCVTAGHVLMISTAGLAKDDGGVGDTSYRRPRAVRGAEQLGKRQCAWLKDGVGCATSTGPVGVDTAGLRGVGDTSRVR